VATLPVVTVIDHPGAVETLAERLVVEGYAIPRTARLALDHVEIGQAKRVEAFDDIIEKRLWIAVV
jgi:hypothetical protein